MKKYIAMAAVTIIFAACSNNELSPEPDAWTDRPVLVSAGVAELVSRAGMTADKMQTLSLTLANAANDKYSYPNVKYVKSGTAFAPEGDTQPLWQNGTQPVTVSAWSPYVEADFSNGYAFCVPADQTTLEAIRAADFLWVSETVIPEGDQAGKKITCTGGLLTLAMQHALSKLVVNLRLGTEMDGAATAITQVVVKGLENACVLDLSAFTVQASASSVKKDIIAYAETAQQGYDATFEAIFPPQSTAFHIMMELSDGRKYLYEHAVFDFQSDYAYTLNLHVGKDKVELASGGITAAPWREDTEANKYLESE